MKTVREIYTAAMGLMDELDGDGSPRDTGEYASRTPGVVNMMISEYRILDGRTGGFVAVEDMDDPVLGIEDTYALGAMHYGLAANLLVDENPPAASFFQQRYEEVRNIFFSRRASAEGEEISDIYGGIEHGGFGRW